MISVVVNGQNCWLLNAAPNTDDTVALFAEMPLDAKRSLTGRTSRRPQAVALRYALEWSAVIRAAEFAALRNAALDAQDEPIVAPVWPFAIRVGIDASVITAGLVVAWNEGWEDVTINPVSLAGFDYAAPAIYGDLKQPPRVEAINDDAVTVSFAVEEDAPAALSFSVSPGILAADVTVNTPAGAPAPVFPFVPMGGDAPSPGVALTTAEHERIGPGRRKARVFYPQLPEQTLQASYLLPTSADAARMLVWWTRRAGGAEAHWVADTQKLGFLAADLAGGDTALNFTADIAPLGAVEYVALFAPGRAPTVARVASETADSLTLTGALAAAWPAASTTVAKAMLARHTDEALQLEFTQAADGWHCAVTLQWREVASEFAPSAGETLGETLGRLPGRAYFFQLDLDYNGALRTWYLTNHEAGAVANLITWDYNACDFDRLIQSIDLEDDSCSMTFRYFAGGPWDNWQPGALSARGYVTIFRADVSPSGVFSNFGQIWKGELRAPKFDGPIVTQKANGANALFARRGPRQVMSPVCGTMLFKARCGLALGDWTFNAEIVAVAGNVVTLGSITRANSDPLPDGFGAENWFALGWLGWLVAGAPYRNGILTSAAIAGGEIVMTLERGLALGVGSNVVLVPGCDRLGSTCRGKFGNYDNFRGFEFMPAVSPSFSIPQRDATAAKK